MLCLFLTVITNASRAAQRADSRTRSALYSAKFMRNVVLILISINNTQALDKGDQESPPSSHLFNSSQSPNPVQGCGGG